MAESEFRELRGDYVANSGQSISLREYLDYFEPLGSALSRLPDGTGGPFVHQFTVGGGRTIGAIGWVVSAASKRFGAWTLWGLWTDRAIPPVALPLFWPTLSDPAKTTELVERANDQAERLFDRKRWPKLLEQIQTHRLRDDTLRGALTNELARAWSVPPPHRRAIEVELTPQLLDLLPWLYILGPVDPATAHLQPGRFNGAGYQWILNDRYDPPRSAANAFDVSDLVENASSDVVTAWRMAHELRTQRGRPAPKPRAKSKPVETKPMRETTTPAPESAPAPTWKEMIEPAFQIVVLVLLLWIAYNVYVIRKTVTAQPDTTATTTTTSAPIEETTTEPPRAPAPVESRVSRIATTLSTRPPRNIRIDNTVLDEIAKGATGAESKLARVGIEIFLRRNACYTRTEIVDGKFSTAEQRAIRSCAVLQDEKLVKTGIDPDNERTLAWLERILAP
ncbi:MAG: hypothetical protein DMF56_08550 [Acidobacteria bacterium]|nr:MAG: hypothetical protein DMF56_08550 [Acidobacteriota bacterium]